MAITKKAPIKKAPAKKKPLVKKTQAKKAQSREPQKKPRGVGKPPKNDPTDVEAIQAKIDAYFSGCLKKGERATFCGLALALDYAALQSLRENARSGGAISLPIKKAMLVIEEKYEQGLSRDKPTGSIFALKNRGWLDAPPQSEGATDNRLTIDFTE